MSQKPDPWEQRERQQKRYQKQQAELPDVFTLLSKNQRPLCLLVCLAILLFSEVPSFSSSLRLGLSTLGTVLLLIALIAYWGTTYKYRGRFFVTLTNVLIGLSFLSALVGFVIAPSRGIATGELLRLIAGTASYFFVAQVLTEKREIGVFLGGLFAFGSAITLYDVSQFAQKTGMNAHLNPGSVSVFGTHESIGSLLALLLPLVVSLALARVLEEKRQLAVQGISVILIFAWIIVRCRSAWIGGGLALALLLCLQFRYNPPARTGSSRRRQSWLSRVIGSPAFLVGGALVFLGIAGGLGSLLSTRLSAMAHLLEDGSVEGRTAMWNGALRMLSVKPVFGWGLGGFLLLQGTWTHMGDSEQQVLLFGTGHQNIAHNYYVQWAADTGTVGVAVFIALMLSLILHGLHAITRASGSWERVILMGATSALVGGAIEVIGSPAFQFSGVWSVFWAIAGLLVPVGTLATDEVPAHTKRLTLLGITAVPVAIAALLLLQGHRAWDPKGQPRGIFQVVERTQGPYYPGDTLRWRATFRNARQIEEGTFPGTTWVQPQAVDRKTGKVIALSLDRAALVPARFSDSDLLHNYSEFSIKLPYDCPPEVQFHALYRDTFGRDYSATRVILVRPRPAPVKLSPTVPPAPGR